MYSTEQVHYMINQHAFLIQHRNYMAIVKLEFYSTPNSYYIVRAKRDGFEVSKGRHCRQVGR